MRSVNMYGVMEMRRSVSSDGLELAKFQLALRASESKAGRKAGVAIAEFPS